MKFSGRIRPRLQPRRETSTSRHVRRKPTVNSRPPREIIVNNRIALLESNAISVINAYHVLQLQIVPEGGISGAVSATVQMGGGGFWVAVQRIVPPVPDAGDARARGGPGIFPPLPQTGRQSAGVHHRAAAQRHEPRAKIVEPG